jgi:hypothetical protein
LFFARALACLVLPAVGVACGGSESSVPSGSSGSSAGSSGSSGASTAGPSDGTAGTGTATPPGTTPAPGALGSFGGSYSVPVAPALAAAATFDVTEFNWTVTGATAALAYNLPRALVGIPLRVSFTGPYDAATGHATLTGAAGTADCTATASTVSCTETMRGLLPIATDFTVVDKLASGYPGPPADRTTVAAQFAGDPIGIALIDLARPGVPEPIEVGSGKKHP